MKALYVIRGVVIPGKKRGKDLGFPTANITLAENVPGGIYAGETIVDRRRYMSAIFIGAAETFGDTQILAESYLLDFNGDLYGKEIRLYFYEKIRENMKFASKKDLIRQIEKDVERVREIMGKTG